MVFGDLSAAVEVGEPPQRLVGLIEVFGLIQLVELLESVPRGVETGVGVEQPAEVRLVGFGEMISPAQEGEAGSEQVRLECWGTQVGVAAVYLPW